MARPVEHIESKETELNLTPLIDCVFLLLIFFMVTTVFTDAASLKIELPQAQEWQTIQETRITLSIGREGRMELNGKQITRAALAAGLRAEKERTGETTLIIKGDRLTRHAYTLDVMETAKEVGIETISLAVDEPEEE